MKLYLPEIYPDELVYSWFARYAIHSGCISNKMIISQLFYSTKNNPSIEFIGHLNKVSEAQIEEMYTLDKLIIEHTMFPQYARFLSSHKQNEAFEKIKKYCDPHNAITILPRNEKERYLRYCPLCAKEDRTIYGETYWHRKHQIRNINICPVHRCKLENTDVMAVTQKTFVFHPAELAVKDIEPVLVDDMEMICFAEYVIDLFDMDIRKNKNIQIRAVIYDAMSETKYIKGQHRNMAQFTADLQTYFEKIGLNSIASIYQIQKVILGDSNEFSVICQISYFLKISVDDLFRSDMAADRIIQEQESHYIRNRLVSDWEKFDMDNVERFNEFCKGVYDGSTNKNGRPERVSERMVYDFLGITAYGFKNMPKCMDVYEKYVESYEELWVRKIVWAYEKIKQERGEKVIYWSDLRKLSGVKKKSLEKISIYLDKEIIDQIISGEK